MSPDRLLTHFDRIAEAPDAIARLRRFVLDLAVRGKLVEQEPNDEPASELLRQIRAERARLVKAGEAGKPKSSAPIQPNEQPIAVPASWAWMRLCDIGTLAGGMTPSKNRADYWDGDVVWLSPKDIKVDTVTDSELKISSKGLSDTRLKLFPTGSLFMVARSGILKRTFPVAINRIPAASNQDLKVLVPYLKGAERFLQIMFRGLTDFILRDLVKTGTTVQSLKYAEFAIQPFPLPPLAEQHRIVAKVDELMALCDRLEAAQNKREQRRDRLAAASLNRINQPAPSADGETATAFREHARFHLAHLPRLTTRPDHIKTLRQRLLNLAFRGRFSAPESWPEKATTLGEVASLQNGYAFKSEWFAKSGTRLLRNANVGHGLLDWTDAVRLPPERVPEFERFRLRQGDVVLSLDRPFIVTGTKVARIREQDLPALLLQRVGRFCLNDEMCSEYLFLWINSPAFSDQIDPGRSNGVPHISSKQVEKATLVVPPVAEQQRIVAKVDELMAVCDQLEAQLTTTQTDSRRLLEAVLHEALAPAMEEAA